MKVSMRFVMLLTMFLLIVLPAVDSISEELSQPTYEVIEELDVKVEMRDGIRLSTNIYRPDAKGAFPVLLMRTPYGNGGAGSKGFHYWAERGYVTIAQDCRGRFESGGFFYPLIHEANDGIDTIRWIIRQPWSNSKIGTFGGSYVGLTQWLPAMTGPPSLKAMFTTVPYSENYSVSFQNGAFRLRLFTEWYAMMTAPYDFDGKDFNDNRIDKVNRFLPLVEQDTQVGWRMPWFRDNVSHPENDVFWAPLKYEGRYKDITSAAYIVAGWFDLFTGQNLKNYKEMAQRPAGKGSSVRQKIVVGPWGHGIARDGKLGDLDFGKHAALNTRDMMLPWFDHHLKGKDTGIDDEPPVRLFVMGDNIWRYEREWPLERTRYTRYYFHSAGKANSRNGDGSLNTVSPAVEAADSFVYDPDNPVPSHPKDEFFSDFRYFPIDHGALEDREDMLVYTTPPLDSDLEVTGPIEVILHAASSALNTDFTGKLLDVYPDGKAIYICDGIIRASFREGDRDTSNIEPGKVYEYRIDLWATSNVFKKGHRIRIEISSSNFPRFDRNLNTGGNLATETEMVRATQTIYHDKDHPSCIVLPVIPR
ncbi:CocE/NonD family hydrolase [Candidatus Latescibacterota bacterium]